MSNRVEELESQVAELQAAVNGLTEELVELKERVRQLEDAREEPDPVDAGGTDRGVAAGPGERTTSSDAHADVVEPDGDDGADDIVVPGEETPESTEGEGSNPEETVDSDDGGESEDSDIIVA